MKRNTGTVGRPRGGETKRQHSLSRHNSTLFFSEPIDGLFWSHPASAKRRVPIKPRGVDRRGSIEDRRRVRA
jgi:hypothetical protein